MSPSRIDNDHVGFYYYEAWPSDFAQPRHIIIKCRFWLKMAHLFFIPARLPCWVTVVPWGQDLASQQNYGVVSSGLSQTVRQSYLWGLQLRNNREGFQQVYCVSASQVPRMSLSDQLR